MRQVDTNDLRFELNQYAHDRNLVFSPERNLYEKPAYSASDPGEQVTPMDLADRCWIDNRRAPLAAYKIAMKMLQGEQRGNRRAETARMLCLDDDKYGLAQKELARLVKLVARKDTDADRLAYYALGWEQLIWQVKRRLLNRATQWEIMLSLVSKTQGSGKTETAKSFGRVLNEFFMPDADCTILSDQFRLAGFERYYLILLDEFDKANKAQVSTFKRLISSETVSGRQIYSDSEVKLSRNASFLVTSNRSIAFDIRDTAMRRFVEMQCREQKVDAAFVERMADIDWYRIWAAADPGIDQAPVSREQELLERFQGELASPTDFELFCSDRLQPMPDERRAYLRCNEAYSSYGQWCRDVGVKPMGLVHFTRHCESTYQVVNHGGRKTMKHVALALPEQ